MTDPIADILTRIRNASLIGAFDLLVPMSKTKFRIAQILEQERYVEKIELINGDNKGAGGLQFNKLRIILKYLNKKPKIKSIARVSKPGLRKYTAKQNIPYVLNGKGIVILSTSSGIMTGKEAKIKKLGGEIICEIY